jgi:hypothetical protein
MTKTLWIAVVSSSALLLGLGCDVGTLDMVLKGKNGGDVTLPGDPDVILPETGNDPTKPDDPTKPVNPSRCDMGKTYAGFAMTDLVGDRVDADLGVDRSRVKPYSSLSGEYTRVLGSTPGLIGGLATTFGEPVARWSVEPQASAVSLYTAYRVAYQGCQTMTGTATQYGAAPDTAAARTECGNFAQKFWSRPAEQAELDSCVRATVTDTASLTNVRLRWAYGCAAVLTAAGFLSY